MNSQDFLDSKSEFDSQRFDLLSADTIEYALFLVGLDGNVMCWNLGAERLFGFRTDEAIGLHFSRLFSPEDEINGQPGYELAAATERGHANFTRWQVRKD